MNKLVIYKIFWTWCKTGNAEMQNDMCMWNLRKQNVKINFVYIYIYIYIYVILILTYIYIYIFFYAYWNLYINPTLWISYFVIGWIPKSGLFSDLRLDDFSYFRT